MTMQITQQDVNTIVEYLNDHGFGIGYTQKHDPPAGVPTAQTLRGPDSFAVANYYQPANASALFLPNAQPGLYNTQPKPKSLFHRLYAPNARNNNWVHEIAVFGGVGQACDEATDNPADVCDDGPAFGTVKFGTLRMYWGHQKWKTNTIHIPTSDATMGPADNFRGNMTAEQLAQKVASSPFIPQFLMDMGADSLKSPVVPAIIDGALTAELHADAVVLNGDPTNNGTPASLRCGFLAEPLGLDSFIATGLLNNETGVAMPQLDAMVETFDALYDADSTATAWAVATSVNENIVEALTRMIYTVKSNLERTGYTDFGGATRGFLVIDDNLFYYLTRIWPTMYYTTGRVLDATAGDAFNLNGPQTRALQDTWYTGKFLPFNGMNIEVYCPTSGARTEVGSDGLVGTGYAEADIRFVLEYANGERVTYIAPYNFRTAGPMQLNRVAGNPILFGDFYWVTNSFQRACIEWHFDNMWRLHVHMPWGCFALDTVRYPLLPGDRRAHIDDPAYVNTGGHTVTTFPWS